MGLDFGAMAVRPRRVQQCENREVEELRSSSHDIRREKKSRSEKGELGEIYLIAPCVRKWYELRTSRRTRKRVLIAGVCSKGQKATQLGL
jgi:hypothetical protein